MTSPRGFYQAIKSSMPFEDELVSRALEGASLHRVLALSADIEQYLIQYLPATITSKESLADYRTNPYVTMTTASTMNLQDPRDFANFLVNLKLYMSLETSFGKSLESVIMGHYPVVGPRWTAAPEAAAEAASLSRLSSEEKAIARTQSVWREIDRSCVAGNRRQLLTIKSGPSTINDTQVSAMTSAIVDHHECWLNSSLTDDAVTGIDVVIGLTYGTETSTNNKENQILVKLLDSGFEEADRDKEPGVLSARNGMVRVFRVVGRHFWSYAADPTRRTDTSFAFAEVLLALAHALKSVRGKATIEDALNSRLDLLANAIHGLRITSGNVPPWVASKFSEIELTWLAAAMTVFFDEGHGRSTPDPQGIQGRFI